MSQGAATLSCAQRPRGPTHVQRAAAAAGLDRLTAALAPEPAFAVRSIRLAVAIGGGLAALAAASKLLRIAEFDDLVQVIGERFRPAGRGPL